jgi:hypothetical protein
MIDEEGVGKHCHGRFSILKPHFENVLVSDLPILDIDRLVKTCDPSKAALMLIFSATVLEKLKLGGEDVDNVGSGETFTLWDSQLRSRRPHVKVIGGILDLSTHVCSDALQPIHPQNYGLSELADEITKSGQANQIFALNLSKSYVFAEQDIDIVRSLVNMLPNCHQVDLSNNRLLSSSKLHESLSNLLAVDHLALVNVVGNNFITPNIYNSFGSVPFLHKLIWIQEEHLAAGLWITKDLEAVARVIINTHLNYYAHWMELDFQWISKEERLQLAKSLESFDLLGQLVARSSNECEALFVKVGKVLMRYHAQLSSRGNVHFGVLSKELFERLKQVYSQHKHA